MKIFIKCTSLMVLLVLTSCVKSENPDTGKEQAKVREVFIGFLKEAEAGNTDGYCSYITDDFLGYDAGAAPITNRDSLRAFLNDFFATNTLRLTNHESQEVIIGGDLAIHRHKGTLIIASKNDTTRIRMDMKYLDVLRKDKNGNWKIYIHSASPNQ